MHSNEQALLSLPTVTLAIVSIGCCIYVCIAIVKAGYVPMMLYCCLATCKIRFNCCGKCICKCYCCRRDNNNNNKYLLSSSGTKNVKTATIKLIVTKSQQQSNMIDIIFWMCITDIFWSIFILLNWMPLSLQSFGFRNIPFWEPIECTILGVYAQIFSVQSPLWHLLLAYNLGYLLLFGTLQSLNQLQNQRRCQYLFVIIIPIIFSILPAFFTKYGIYANNNTFDKECWIKSEEWQLISICSILLSLLFHYIILILLCCKYKKYRNNKLNHLSKDAIYSYQQQYKSVISRLSRFVFVYTFIRILPSIERIWECFTIGPPPFWLIVGHHISISTIGIANFIAWNINQMDPNTNWSSRGGGHKKISKLLHDIYEEERKNTFCVNSDKPSHTTLTTTATTVLNNDDNTLNLPSTLTSNDTAGNTLGLDSKFLWNTIDYDKFNQK